MIRDQAAYDAHVAKLVAEAPELTDEQAERIRAILRPALERIAADAALSAPPESARLGVPRPG